MYIYGGNPEVETDPKLLLRGVIIWPLLLLLLFVLLLQHLLRRAAGEQLLNSFVLFA